MRRAILILLLAPILALAGVEAFLRWRISRWTSAFVPTGIEHPAFVQKPDMEYSVRAYGFHLTYRSNRHGLRGPDFDLDKGGRRRILLVGDSVVFGALVEERDTLSEQLQGLLNGGGARWQVLNGGAGAQDLRDYEGWLRMRGFDFKPDIVIVGIYRNDFLPDQDPGATTAAPPSYPWLARLRGSLLRLELLRSAIYLLCRHQTAKHPLVAIPKPLRPEHRAALAAAFPGDPGTEAAVKDYLAAYRYEPGVVTRPLPAMIDPRMWKNIRKPLAEIRDQCRRRGIPLLAIVFPTQFEVYPGYRWPEPGRTIAGILDALGIPFVDMQPVYAATGHGDELFSYRYDIAHPNREAYRLCAEALRDLLKKKRLYPGR